MSTVRRGDHIEDSVSVRRMEEVVPGVSRIGIQASRIDIDESQWSVGVSTEHATVTATYRLFGHDAEWPSLQARESDHETTDADTFASWGADLLKCAWRITISSLN